MMDLDPIMVMILLNDINYLLGSDCQRGLKASPNRILLMKLSL